MRSVFLFFLTSILVAQEPRFAAQSRLVLVPVTVTDGKGRPIDGLEAEDFRILDNGNPQKPSVDTIATGVAPIALVIAVQSSGISTAVLEKVKKIGAMIEPLITGERGCAALVSFAERVTWHQDCTHDQYAFERALQQLRPGEDKSARMLDAVDQSVHRLALLPRSRRILLLIAESRDRGSESDLDAVTIAAQSAGVTIYAATYSAFKTAFTSKSSAPKPRPKKPGRPGDEKGTINGGTPTKINPPLPPAEQRVDILAGFGEIARLNMPNTAEVLANGTGGIKLPFTRQKGLEDAIEKLGAELHTQYMLSYTPELRTPGYHHLVVQVTRAGEFQIRAQPGYWLTEESR